MSFATSLFKSKDNITAVVSTVIAILALFASFYNTDPEVYLFPRIASVIIAILAAILLLKVFLSSSNSKANNATSTQLINWASLWPGLLVGFIYLVALEVIGFYVSSFIAYFALCVIYGKCEMTDLRRGIFKLGVSTIFMIVLFVLFWNLLHVRTPTGLLI